jgi:hypothetical protein
LLLSLTDSSHVAEQGHTVPELRTLAKRILAEIDDHISLAAQNKVLRDGLMLMAHHKAALRRDALDAQRQINLDQAKLARVRSRVEERKIANARTEQANNFLTALCDIADVGPSRVHSVTQAIVKHDPSVFSHAHMYRDASHASVVESVANLWAKN